MVAVDPLKRLGTVYLHNILANEIVIPLTNEKSIGAQLQLNLNIALLIILVPKIHSIKKFWARFLHEYIARADKAFILICFLDLIM